MHSADTFNDHVLIPTGEEAIDSSDRVWVESLASQLGGGKRSDRQLKGIGTNRTERLLTLNNGAQPGRIRPSGFPADTPVSIGFMTPTERPRFFTCSASAAATSVFPTPVSVPVIKTPYFMEKIS